MTPALVISFHRRSLSRLDPNIAVVTSVHSQYVVGRVARTRSGRRYYVCGHDPSTERLRLQNRAQCSGVLFLRTLPSLEHHCSIVASVRKNSVSVFVRRKVLLFGNRHFKIFGTRLSISAYYLAKKRREFVELLQNFELLPNVFMIRAQMRTS